MEQVWPWITSHLPSSPASDSHTILLAGDSKTDVGKSIILQAETIAAGSGADSETPLLVTFSISLLGFNNLPVPANSTTSTATLWLSNQFPISSTLTPYHFLTQLVQETISLYRPTDGHGESTAAPSLEVHHIADIMDMSCRDVSASSSPAAALFTLLLICRLFWLCAADAPADAGFLFFRSVGPTLLGRALLDCRPALRSVLAAVGPDWEEIFMRSIGYVLAKWCILRELQGSPPRPLIPSGFCPSYVADSHGLWILKGYAPISAIPKLNSAAANGAGFDVRDSVLRYALAHQQLEAVVQLEYTVNMRDPRYIGVSIRVDNIRLHVVRLGFGKVNEQRHHRQTHDDNNDMEEERHFPSRVRIWAGPEFGSAYATGLSLGRSTGNPERELETTQIVKGKFGTSQFPAVKARSRSSVRSRGKNWRWEQEAEGNAGVFEGVLCDEATGAEVAASGGMRRRYTGAGRCFSKGGGLVVGADEIGEGVSWRVGREMEGRVFKWRVGGKVWVSYYPNEVKSGYFETRCVEWGEDVDLALVACG